MNKITETNDIRQIAIEEPLSYLDWDMPNDDLDFRGSEIDRPVITIGKPSFWKLELEKNKTMSLQSRGDFLLTRLAFSLKTLKSPVESATLSIKLSSDGGEKPTAFDLFPRHQLVEKNTNIKLIIGPELKFLDVVDISLAKAEMVIENVQVIPIMEAFGIGESEPEWVFKNHNKYPLSGIRIVYLLIEKPKKQIKATLKINLEAEIKTHLGLKRATLRAKPNNLSWDF